MDFGNSALKVAYATETEDGVCLRFSTYRYEALPVVLQEIKERIGDKLVGEENVALTGLFCSEHDSEIDSTLGIKSKTTIESECFVKGFNFLMNNFPLKELVHPKDPKIQEQCQTISNVMNAGMKQMAVGHLQPLLSYSNEPQIESIDEHKLQYPAMLAMCGSACCIVKVINKDGDYETPDLTPLSGRTLLAGTKSFPELIELAEKGSTLKMDSLSSDNAYVEDEAYAQFSMDMEVFIWGKAVGKDLGSFSREDRAAAAISMVAESLSSYTHQWAHMCDVKHVYFCGGLPNSAVVRDKLQKYFTVRAKRYPLGTVEVQPHFLKLGAYLGVLGGLLENLGTC